MVGSMRVRTLLLVWARCFWVLVPFPNNNIHVAMTKNKKCCKYHHTNIARSTAVVCHIYKKVLLPFYYWGVCFIFCGCSCIRSMKTNKNVNDCKIWNLRKCCSAHGILWFSWSEFAVIGLQMNLFLVEFINW